ncbi:MAG: HIT family protein [Gemmataceae bacterium]
MSQPPCPFCRDAADRAWLSNDIAFAIWDAYPVAEGHALVFPKRHVTSLYDLSAEEQAVAWSLVARVRETIAERLRPDGFNIGLNDGVAAGQTVMHAHIHVIPRRHGDVPDPRGGVRWVIADKAAYWAGERT